MKTIGFFNNKGGVGKTTLVYHVAWMLAQLGRAVVVADFDSQATLTSAFLTNERLEEIWESETVVTVAGALRPLIDREGDLLPPSVERVGDFIGIIIGDLGLSRAEDTLSEVWPKCLSGDIEAFRVISAFHRMIQGAAREMEADIALLDIGPNLGAINRSALLACDCIVIPLGTDLGSLLGLRNLGPTLREWRRDWAQRLERKPRTNFEVPAGTMMPSGYVIMRYAERMARPLVAFGEWAARVPAQYAEFVLASHDVPASAELDPSCLAMLEDYRSLMPLAQEAQKPMFLLKPGDGAFGGHQQAVQECYRQFRELTLNILSAVADASPASAGSDASR